MSTAVGGGTVALPIDLVELVESGVSILIGTRDAQNRPEALRGSGCIVSAERTSLVLLLPEVTSRKTRANLEAGSPIAITFSLPMNYKSVQVKGRCRCVREPTAAETEVARGYSAQFAEQLYVVGISRGLSRRFQVVPARAAEIEICELYQQTPGPGAGARMQA